MLSFDKLVLLEHESGLYCKSQDRNRPGTLVTRLGNCSSLAAIGCAWLEGIEYVIGTEKSHRSDVADMLDVLFVVMVELDVAKSKSDLEKKFL